MNLMEQIGDIDIYLLDQILKGRITKDMRILDAGCGSGRNLVYFLRNGYEVFAVDKSETAIRSVQLLGARLSQTWTNEHARVGTIEQMRFARESFDFVISNAVLHFAENELHFQQMLNELWRVLKPGGLLFVRLASTLGIEDQIEPLGDGRYIQPDGSTRFLVNEAKLIKLTDELNGILFEPLKTVVVAGQRSMSTWCVEKIKALDDL
ncbi:class I SAM-dependent methyltransferase [Paenibacillus psychroresistens]|uniref:Class I SAM-dependent methyltransferase n=2 Tax=Paenibacillus psychroresistens TaxID=1778678 RepID=A0A6B8RZN6_9BACL|nr:class I SAM-dependent methyltransferase [Paenibacillus psychroresistens]